MTYIANIASAGVPSYAHRQFDTQRPTTRRENKHDLVGERFSQVAPPSVIYPTCRHLHTAVVPSHNADQDARLAWCWQFVGSGKNEFNGGAGSPLVADVSAFTKVNDEMCQFRHPHTHNSCRSLETAS